MTPEQHIAIRPAVPADLATLDSFIRELAREEELPQVSASRSDLHEVLFGEAAFASAVVVEADAEAIGFALYYPKYATVSGRRGYHLEDVYVAPAYRGRGVGEQLLDHLEDAAGRDGMVDWWVMRTNDRAIRFYRRMGARELDGIAVFRRDHRGPTSRSGQTGLSSAEHLG